MEKDGKMVATTNQKARFGMQGSLELLGTITIAPTQEFVARDHFVVGDDPVKIAFVSPDFEEWFLGQVEEPVTQETKLCYSKLESPSTEDLILAELGDKADTTLAQLWSLLERQPNGEDGVLFVDKWANIFYVNGRTVYLICLLGVGWFVLAGSVARPFWWDLEYRVFSRHS